MENPYKRGGYSEEYLGGQGSFDKNTDYVAIPGDGILPNVKNKMYGFYALNVEEVNYLASWLWNKDIVSNVIAEINGSYKFLNSIKWFPFEIETSNEYYHMNVGLLDVPYGQYLGDYWSVPKDLFQRFSFGTITIPKYYDGFSDYDTIIELFLPYIGTVNLNPKEVIGKSITLSYRVDLMTGSCVAYIMRDEGEGNFTLLNSYSGEIGTDLPITSVNYTQEYKTIAKGIGLIAAAAVSAGSGMAAGAKAASLASQASQDWATYKYKKSHGIKAKGGWNTYRDDAIMEQGLADEYKAEQAADLKSAGRSISSISLSPAGVPRNGSFNVNTFNMLPRYPYVTILRPKQCMQKNYGKLIGFPSNIQCKISELSGYNTISQIRLDGLCITTEELDELNKVLKGGVVF